MNGMYMYENGCHIWTSGFLEIFQKPLGGHSKPPGDHTNSEHFLGSCKEPPSGELGAARRRVTYHPVLGFYNEEPGGSD